MLSCFSFNFFTTDYLYKQITNNKLMFPKKTEHPFLHLMASCLETGMATIPKINTNIYSVPRIIVFKIQRDFKLLQRNHSVDNDDKSART